MSFLRWHSACCGLGLGLLTTTSTWATPPGILVQNHGALSVSFGVLTLTVGVLSFIEVHDALKKRKVAELPPAAGPESSPEVTGSAVVEASQDMRSPAASPAAVLTSAPPPPPPSMTGAPPPPPAPPLSPPPPLSPASLPVQAAEDPSAAANPISGPALAGAIQEVSAPPAPGGQDSGSGGWGDLLKRVSSPESGELPSAPKGLPVKSSTVSIPVGASAPLPPRALEADGWDALLKKTAGQNGSPFSSQPGGFGFDPEPGRADSEGNEGGLPDFIKKSSRTISLDLSKGSAASNPFQKPPPQT